MDRNEPLVSIITVVFNAAATIERTIQSVLSQSYGNIEYIIIDGGSTDGTLDVIDKYRDRFAYFVSEPDGGIYDAMNKGIRKATGDIIGLLNADDWYKPDAIKVVADAYKRTGADIIVGEAWVIDEKGRGHIRGNSSFDELWRGISACHQSIFITRNTYERFGLYDTQYELCADHELLLRMYHNGVTVFMTDDILVNYSATGKSSRSSVKLAEEAKAIMQQYLDKYPGKEREIFRLHEESLVYVKARAVCDSSPDDTGQILSKFGLRTGEDCAVWGTGVWGGRIAGILLKHGIEIPFFVDISKSKQDGLFNGIPVKSPEAVRNYAGTVFLAVKDHDADIAQRLSDMNNPGLHWVTLRDFIDAAAACYDEMAVSQDA